ncbi:hypothetical protein ScPMuIL_006442 [Solemya velum]
MALVVPKTLHGKVRMAWNATENKVDENEDEIEGRYYQEYHKFYRLLTETKVHLWRASLVHLLKQYYQHDAARSALRFLITVVDRAKVTKSQRGSWVNIDLSLKPQYIDLEDWRQIMINLNLELTEPDTNRDITLVSLSVTHMTSLSTLEAFHLVLLGLHDLSWANLQMCLYLENQMIGQEFLEIIMDVTKGHSIRPGNQKTLSLLYERYGQSLRS